MLSNPGTTPLLLTAKLAKEKKRIIVETEKG